MLNTISLKEPYTAWDCVPAHLKTKSAFRAEGLRRTSGQQPAAQFCSYKKGKEKPEYYDLYEVSQAIPIDTLEPGYILAQVGYWQMGKKKSQTTHRATLVGARFDEIVDGDHDLGGSVKGLAYVQPGQILTYWSAVSWNRGCSKASFWIVVGT